MTGVSAKSLDLIETHRAELEPTLDLGAVARLHDEICTATEAAETALESLDALCGPNPGPVAAGIKGELVLGVQRYRFARDLIRALWRARNSLKRKSKHTQHHHG